MAVKAAKGKATYLAESVNEKLGETITITEPEESISSDVASGYFKTNAKMYSNAISKADGYASTMALLIIVK